MSDDNELFDDKILAELEPSPQRELLRHCLTAEPPPYGRQIFTTRTLRMDLVRYVGFDLDWTLADYDREAMTRLAFDLTLKRLVERFDYPSEALACAYRKRFTRRGLMLDIEKGMVLKMDRHRYVGRAYHGRTQLSREERAGLYRSAPINPSSPRFYFVDTLFELPEVNIFSELVELKKRHPDSAGLPAFPQIFRDVRQAIDSIHADGTLKERILSNVGSYLTEDDQLILALQRLSLSGRKLILITNSEWFYTDGLCRQIFKDQLPHLSSWVDLFSLVVVSACKPAFFRKTRPFVRLDHHGQPQGEVEVPEWGGVYSGGCREGLEKLLDCPGEQMLYVGDHIYGDIFSSKRTSTWRTALVIKEMETELETRQRLTSQIRHTQILRSEVANFGLRMDGLRDVLHLYDELTANGATRPRIRRVIERCRDDLEEMRREHKVMRQHVRRLQARISKDLNRYWGSIFKQGSNKSLFGSQVDDFACIYTSRVSNFANYGSNHYFRVPNDAMKHEDDD